MDTSGADYSARTQARSAYNINQERMHSHRKAARPGLLLKALEEERPATQRHCTRCDEQQPITVWCRHEMCSGDPYMCAKCDQKVHMGMPQSGECFSPVVRQTLSHRRCVWICFWEPLPRECYVVVEGGEAAIHECKLFLWPDVPCRMCGEQDWRRNFVGHEPELLCFTVSGVVPIFAGQFTCGTCLQGALDQTHVMDCNAGFFSTCTDRASSPVVWADCNLLSSLFSLVCSRGGGLRL
jgi:hypothetical protein